MRKIDKLLYRGIIPPFLISLTVLTFVVFVREVGRLAELLITRNATPEVVGIIASAILPGILIFSLPLAFLVGILIGLSGLSGESQIVALRACGVPLRAMLRPILVLAMLVGAATGILSIIVLPLSNNAFYTLKDRISLRHATNQIQPRVFNEDFPNVVFYLDDLAIDRQRWSRVFLVDNADPKSPRTVVAREGTWVTDADGSRLQLHLENGTIYEVDPENPAKDKLSIFAATDIPIELNHGAGAASEGGAFSRSKKPIELSTSELWYRDPRLGPAAQVERNIELHRRIAIPFTVLGFSLLGLTLGISTKKGGRISGFVLSLGLVLLFYALFFNGLRLASVSKLPPWLGAWSANIILTLLGLALLATGERGSWLSHWISNWRWKGKLEPIGRRLHLEATRPSIRKIDSVIHSSTSKIARFRFPKVLDVYVTRGFLAYFLWATVVCSALFVILTLFDLMDDIIRNKIGISHVVSYFVFLMPQILMFVVPMSILLAILINFGILEKRSEITALKAGGWSLYRIAVPAFLVAAALCASLYFVQDYVLPYANIRQDSLRNVIKGRPVQTSKRPQRKWIFGETDRIFNYDYFDAAQRLFIGLNVFEIDLRGLKILRRMHAERATIDPSGNWIFEEGWIRDFQAERASFKRLTRAQFSFPEKAAYFEKEIFEPKESSKLSYPELKEYINYLKKSGYNATELQVELYKKVSFPFSCVIMAIVGVPFSFSMGRKGAFLGITLSIAIAIVYWGVFGVFEQMGSYGLLAPLLSAWAPNVLFAASGLALLFTIRT